MTMPIKTSPETSESAIARIETMLSIFPFRSIGKPSESILKSAYHGKDTKPRYPRAKRFLLVASLAFAWGHGASALAVSPSAQQTGNRFVQENTTQTGVQVKIETLRADDANAIRAAGFGFVRFGVWVDRLDDVAYRDRVAGAFRIAASAGLPVLVTVRSTQPLIDIRTAAADRPEALEAAGLRFAQAVEQLARTFGSGMLAIELWNEPDLEKYWPTGDVSSTFGPFMRAVCARLQTHPPGLPVIGFGFSRAPRPDSAQDALLRTATHGHASCVDAVSYHAYGMTAGAIREVARDIRKRYGMPAVITEWGVPSEGIADGNGTDAQARRVRTFLTTLDRNATPLVSLYEWKDTRSGTNSRERSYGLVSANGDPKPALAAARASLRTARGDTSGSLKATVP